MCAYTTPIMSCYVMFHHRAFSQCPSVVSSSYIPRYIHRPLSLLVTFIGSIPAEVYITLGLSCLVRSAASDLPNREVALVKFISNHENPPELVRFFYSRVLVRELHLNRSSSSALSHNNGNARADRQVANKVYPVCQSSHTPAHTYSTPRLTCQARACPPPPPPPRE